MNSLHNDDKTASDKHKLPFEVHPAADLFPMMDAKTFAELVEDIREHGVNESIVFWKGKLLDGRNRSLALMELGLDPLNHACDIDTEDLDPVAYVLSTNLHRRHLSVSERAIVAAKVRESFDDEAKKRMVAGTKVDPVENLPQGKARDKAGELLNVSGKTVDAATKILKCGDDEIIAAVETGKMTVNAAVKKIASPKKILVESEEDAERAKEQQEKRERDTVAENLANKIIKMDHRTRSAVMRRVNADESIKATKMQKVAKEQRRGEGTAKDHVRTCIVESSHRLHSAIQQNGPGTNKRWMASCNVEEKSEIRTFAANVSSMAKTLSDYLSENMRPSGIIELLSPDINKEKQSSHEGERQFFVEARKLFDEMDDSHKQQTLDLWSEWLLSDAKRTQGGAK